ncbi:MAG: hypothetical protein A2W29_08965 [Gemmatimonadetes bacterium RBG_16_66_8]|nr:MAG: hypothetical protein A2W29_08965 [Gemmatimonadetes bacterium RBG_16_66_8]
MSVKMSVTSFAFAAGTCTTGAVIPSVGLVPANAGGLPVSTGPPVPSVTDAARGRERYSSGSYISCGTPNRSSSAAMYSAAVCSSLLPDSRFSVANRSISAQPASTDAARRRDFSSCLAVAVIQLSSWSDRGGLGRTDGRAFRQLVRLRPSLREAALPNNARTVPDWRRDRHLVKLPAHLALPRIA